MIIVVSFSKNTVPVQFVTIITEVFAYQLLYGRFYVLLIQRLL